MKKLLIIAVISMFACLVGCGSHNREVSDHSTELAKAAIDSVMATDSSKMITSLTFVKSKMPALWADTLKKEKEKLGKTLGFYLMALAFSGESMKTEEDYANIVEQIIEASASYRAKVKKYEESDSQDYLFGLAEIHDKNDTTFNLKTVFIFDIDNPKEIINAQAYTRKDQDDLILDFMVMYIEDVDEIKKMKDLKALELKFVKDNPIYEFLLKD